MAEIGSNWLGRESLALRHIREAAASGVHGVKFQLFRAKELYDIPPSGLERFELSLELLPILRHYAHENGVEFSVTPYSPVLAEALHGHIDQVKVSAYDLTYDDLLTAVAQLNVPIVLSTAMATLAEIKHALEVLAKPLNQDVTLLHGVAAYPAARADTHLARMALLQATWPSRRVGLSDHSIGIGVSQAAAYMGALHIEKHTKVLLPEIERDSPDAPHSVSFRKIRSLIAAIEDIPLIYGKHEAIGPLPSEMPLFETCRRSNAHPQRKGISE